MVGKKSIHHVNWFSQGGKDYARFRPTYPRALVDYLAGLAADHHRALDVGCGSGQLTRLLADSFDEVIGIDASESQLTSAIAHPRIRYLASPAESLPADIGKFSLVTVAQAAHWFRLDAFYTHVRRVAAPGAILALISYGIMAFAAPLDARFRQFYEQEIGAFWPPERRLVDQGYQTLAFPFEEITPIALHIQVEWDFAAFCGYLSTWSAVKKAEQAGQQHIVERFVSEFATLWGDPTTVREIIWPIALRVGRISERDPGAIRNGVTAPRSPS